MPKLLNDQPAYAYANCANCNDEYSETIEWNGRPLCEECYNAWKCGCELCAKVAVATALANEAKTWLGKVVKS
jgi:hypothetical protein